MSNGSHETKQMLDILDTAISLLCSGETDAEVFGVGPDGTTQEVVLIMIRGEDWHHYKAIVDRLSDGGATTFEEHSFGDPDDN